MIHGPYNDKLISGVFLLVRPQLCHVPPCLYVRRVFDVRLFHIQEGGGRFPETSCYHTVLHGRTSQDSNVHGYFEILSVQKLMLTRLINKFPSPHGTRSFVTVFTTANHNVCASSLLRTYSTICSLELVAREAIFVITVHRYFPWPSKNLISKTTVQKGKNLV